MLNMCAPKLVSAPCPVLRSHSGRANAASRPNRRRGVQVVKQFGAAVSEGKSAALNSKRRRGRGGGRRVFAADFGAVCVAQDDNHRDVFSARDIGVGRHSLW